MARSTFKSNTSKAADVSFQEEDGGISITEDVLNRRASSAGLHNTQPPSLTSETTVKSRPAHCGRISWYIILPDLLNLGFSVLFTVLGIFVVKLKDKPESPWTIKVVYATQIAPTLWPVLFAAVLGNAIKAFANWRVERGIRLGTLEQLMGSQTLASTIRTFFIVPAFTLPTFMLIFLWAFNPLGSQASLRGIYLRNNTAMDTHNITYFNYSLEFDITSSGFTGLSTFSYSRPIIRAFYNFAIVNIDAGTQYSSGSSDFNSLISRLGGTEAVSRSLTEDGWGNVRIPYLRTLEGFDAENPDKWLDVPWEKSVVNYASLIGTTFRGIPSESIGNWSFVIDANYHTFDCSPWLGLTSDESRIWVQENCKMLSTYCNATLDQDPQNTTLSLPFLGGFVIDTTYDANEAFLPFNASVPQRKIFFASKGSDELMYWTTCAVAVTYVEANVICESHGTRSKKQCAVDRIRQTSHPPMDPHYTAFDFPLTRNGIIYWFPKVVNPEGEQHEWTSTQTELFISDPVNAVLSNVSSIVDIGNTPIELFQERFGLLFNTFWRASVNPGATAGGPMEGGNLSTITATRVFPLPPVYALNSGWISVFFLANAVMIIAAVVAILLHLQCRAPELLGYVSSLARDSPYFRRESGNSVENGAESAKRLKELIVRVGDVKVGEEVGRIAFAPEDMAGKVQRGKLYQ